MILLLGLRDLSPNVDKNIEELEITDFPQETQAAIEKANVVVFVEQLNDYGYNYRELKNIFGSVCTAETSVFNFRYLSQHEVGESIVERFVEDLN